MSHSLHSLLESIGVKVPHGWANPLIEKVVCDSRSVEKGSLFVGLPGDKFDGGRFWLQALSLGAEAAIIGPIAAKDNPPGPKDLVIVATGSITELAGELLSVFWERPSLNMALIGVTGTNGKTTTTHLLMLL